MKTTEISILELARGAVMEQVNNEMSRVMANILDPNTEPKATRKLTITLTFKPDESREIVATTAQAKATLAPVKPVAASIIVASGKDGKPVAAELTKHDPNQMTIFEEPEPEKIIKLERSV